MDKKIYSRVLLPIITVLSVIYFSCDDAGITNKNEDSEFCISATLSGWVPGDKILYALRYSHDSASEKAAECTVNDEGTFKLCLPQLLADSTLFQSESIFYSNCTGGTVNFNPPDVLGTQIYNFLVSQNNIIVGRADCNNFARYDSIKAGDFEVEYIYVNKDVTVSGYKVCTNDTLRFNGTATKGWNKIVKHYVRVSPTSMTKLYDNVEPPGAVWEYHGN